MAPNITKRLPPDPPDPANRVSKTTSMSSISNRSTGLKARSSNRIVEAQRKAAAVEMTLNAVQVSRRTIADNVRNENVNPESPAAKTDAIIIDEDCPSLPTTLNLARNFEIFDDVPSNNPSLITRDPGLNYADEEDPFASSVRNKTNEDLKAPVNHDSTHHSALNMLDLDSPEYGQGPENNRSLDYDDSSPTEEDAQPGPIHEALAKSLQSAAKLSRFDRFDA